MPDCNHEPDDKRAFGQAVGNDLLRHHGKRKYYSPQQVQASCTRLDYPVDWHCWAMSLYTSPEDFTAYHDAIGEVCDQSAMKSQMVSALTDGASASWFDMDMSWFDWPGVDLSGVFDGVDWT